MPSLQAERTKRLAKYKAQYRCALGIEAIDSEKASESRGRDDSQVAENSMVRACQGRDEANMQAGCCACAIGVVGGRQVDWAMEASLNAHSNITGA
jgi:hypothetical protein